MGWIAEILRKDHRACERCDLGPTHVYDPIESDEEIPEGTPLCTSCLGKELAGALAGFAGRGVLFEPALGPDALVFRDLDGSPHHDSSRNALKEIREACDACSEKGQFVWIGSAPDANLWDEDWLEALSAGTLEAGQTLCAGCAAARLEASIETRGLYFEAIFPPTGSNDIVMFGSNAG